LLSSDACATLFIMMSLDAAIVPFTVFRRCMMTFIVYALFEFSIH
jgi:hypothetical protein